MTIASGEEPPPRSTDLEGWRRAVDEGHHRGFRLEEIVAAIQDLGPAADKAVINSLAKHLNDALLAILRQRVSAHYPNRGEDIIWRTHGQIIEAILQPNSADGKALRIAFVPRVLFRIKDALASEARAARSLRETREQTASTKATSDAAPPPTADSGDPTDCHDPSADIDESLDVESILEQVADDQKRLAFRFYMDGVPFKSTKGHSIATALGISERTAREWVKEVRELLTSAPEVQGLLQSKKRGIR